MLLYETVELYDLTDNKDKEKMLKGHYEEVLKDKAVKSIHDCSIGTGSLTFVLSDMGYDVSGSDLSETMLGAAKNKAKDLNIEVPLFISDFRSVKEKMKNPVDLMMITGNSLPHVPNGDIKRTMAQLATCVNDGGYIYLDIRNWDKIIESKQRFYTYNPFFVDGDRVNLVQVWDYLGDQVTFNLLYTFERDQKIYRKETVTTTYYPLRRELLMEALTEAGFGEIETYGMVQRRVVNIDEMDWYVVVAKKVN